MYKSSSSSLSPWICAACLSKAVKLGRRFPKRLHSTAAAGAIQYEPRSIHISDSAPGAIHDDTILRKIFDHKEFWKDFSQSSKPTAKGHNAGLFRNKYLTSPQGFMAFSQNNLRKAKMIVERVMTASTKDEYRRIARDMDRLSDMLCRVIDLSDFVRATHPDWRFQSAANDAHSMMLEYMNQLNTMPGMNEQLAVAMADEDVFNGWTEEERVVARALKRDFANSAISLPKAMRDRFVKLSQEIAQVGPEFVDMMEPERRHVSVPSSKLKGMDPRLVKQLTKWSTANVPTQGEILPTALRTVLDEDVRRDLYLASRTASQSQLARLDVLLAKRAQLAKLTGFKSYAHHELGEKMAKSPESVNNFLQALAKGNRHRVEQELQELLQAKTTSTDTSSSVLQPWDKDFYIYHIRRRSSLSLRSSSELSAYFSLGTVMQGLSRLFTRLYGIRFVPRETLPGEGWNSDVRRIDVISENDGHVAVLYCDLFSRPGKSPNPAHFTLRCSREIQDHELGEEDYSNVSLFNSTEQAANDGMSTSRASGVLKQLPTIALICDFRTPSNGYAPALLGFTEVQTLFHEMGHAIHSILGRTSLQEVSGTRCATDFAELPSVLMEHFAADPTVLSLFARHYQTDAPLPYELVAQRLAIEKRFRGVDTETQILLAMVDQAYHSDLPLSVEGQAFNTSTVFQQIQREHSAYPPDPYGTSWQGFFGHLFGYGATYYSYLFDQILAERIWQVVFKGGKDGGSIGEANGEKLKESVLKWGGGRDPWTCVSEVLGDERIKDGGEEAMAIVGGWGLERQMEK